MDRYDVIVIGGGLAGFCAAVEACEQGGKVLLLEKEDQFGGSTVLSSGYMAFAGTDMQQAEGIEDSEEALKEDMLEVGGHVNDVALVEAYVHHQKETYLWLKERGIQFRSLHAGSGHRVPRGHTIDPYQAIQVLHGILKQSPIATVRLNSPAVRLVRDAATGRINQVEYLAEGKKEVVVAEKGVILTSGGFSMNSQLLHHFAPHLDEAIIIGGDGNQGDGLLMAWEHGAWVKDLPYLNGTYGFHPSARGPVKTQGLAYYRGAIIVNIYGKRFVNESISYKLIGNAALQQPESLTFQIWDQTVMDKSVPDDPLYDLDLLDRRRLLYKADTLEELADYIDVPTDNLVETITRYNEGVRQGEEPDYGRKTLIHQYGQPTPIETPPFYAFEATTAVLATYAGIAVNAHGQVLNPYGEPILGLYAAGEITGGFHGAGYMTGSSLGKAAIFGRVAAREALITD